MGFPDGSVVKNPPARDTGDVTSIPGLGRSLGEGHGITLSVLSWKMSSRGA